MAQTKPLARVLIVTGSGISADSGIPTFRGEGGYWRNLDPTKLATEAAFRQDPELVWQWYQERRDLIRRSQPNAAHRALVQLAQSTQHFMLLTQNVDDLHSRAEWEGQRLAPEQIVKIHGDIFVTKCSRCSFALRATSENQQASTCPNCGAMLRPGVVWFDEELDPNEVHRIKEFNSAGPCDVVIVIGTTASFDYIVRWALVAKGADGRLIEINPEETPMTKFATQVIHTPAAQSLPALVERLVA